MRLTLGKWLGGLAVFSSGIILGRLSVSVSRDTLVAPLVSVNESAPLIQTGDDTVRLRDLDAPARFALHRILEQAVMQAQRFAENHAALTAIDQKKTATPSWRSLLEQELSAENLRKIYEATPSLRQSGSFDDVWPEIERFVMERERLKRVGEFLEKSYQSKQLKYMQNDLVSPQFSFDVSGYPLITFGKDDGKVTAEVVVLFRYGGRLSQGAFSLIADIAREQESSIAVRLVPEVTNSPFDQFASGMMFAASEVGALGPVKLRELHEMLLKEPILADNTNSGRNEQQLISALAVKLPGKGFTFTPSRKQPSNAVALSSWWRDVRTNRLPMFFVNGSLVSENSPRGLPDALRSALGIQSVVGR